MAASSIEKLAKDEILLSAMPTTRSDLIRELQGLKVNPDRQPGANLSGTVRACMYERYWNHRCDWKR